MAKAPSGASACWRQVLIVCHIRAPGMASFSQLLPKAITYHQLSGSIITTMSGIMDNEEGSSWLPSSSSSCGSQFLPDSIAWHWIRSVHNVRVDGRKP